MRNQRLTLIKKQYPYEYRSWLGAKTRCTGNKNKDYGGRGIKMCEKWINSFEDFIIDMGSKPSPKHQLDRINTNGNYEPGNCRWATCKQNCNNRRSNRMITFGGETLTLTEWSERTGIETTAITSRLDALGWSIEDALTRGLNRKTLLFKGEALTVAEWSSRTGIAHQTINERLAYGWSIEEALTKSLAHGGLADRLLTHQRETLTLNEWAQRTGINKTTIESRLRMGWTVENALTRPILTIERLITFREETLNISQWSKRTGINIGTLKDRLDCGWTIEKALTEPPIDKKRYLTFKGETFSADEWGERTGIYHKTILSRINKGWSVEKALTKKPKRRTNQKIQLHTFLNLSLT